MGVFEGVHESMFQSHVFSCVFDVGVMAGAPVETWHADGWGLILQDLYRGMKIPRQRNENVMLIDGAGRQARLKLCNREV